MTTQKQEWLSLLQELTGQDVSNLDPDTDLVQEWGLDSLARLRLLAGVEKHFNVRLPDAQLASLRTLRQLMLALHNTTTARPASSSSDDNLAAAQAASHRGTTAPFAPLGADSPASPKRTLPS